MLGEADRAGETDGLSAVFETVEQCLLYGTPETINLVVVGLLEDLQYANTLAKPYPRTPAMAAGLSDHIWTCEEIAALLD